MKNKTIWQRLVDSVIMTDTNEPTFMYGDTSMVRLKDGAASAVRWMIRKDMEAVLDIDFAGCLEPWLSPEYKEFLLGRSNIGMIVGEATPAGTEVRGSMLYEPSPTAINIARMVVDIDHRRRWFAATMIRHLKLKLRPDRRYKITATVPEYCDDMLMCLKSAGFISLGYERKCFEHDGHHADGIFMDYRMPQSG